MTLKWWVLGPRGLALPADMPRLDIDGAIGRRWILRPDNRLIIPGPAATPRYLPTYPVRDWPPVSAVRVIVPKIAPNYL